MTEISFHTGVPDVLGYACRLLRKAVKKGSRVAVCADAALLAQLDRALWTFDPTDFTPHRRLAPGASPPARFAATPVWLLEADADDAPLRSSPVHEVLVNLGPEPVPGFESFERVLEVVGRDTDAADAGRRRWRHYTERGYAVVHHQAKAA
jgi:DNA polymerase III subunit chi